MKEPPIEVTSRHEQISDRMKSYAIEKAGKLLKYHNRISRIQVVVDGAHEAPEVEIIVHVDSGATFVAKEHREHFKSAIDFIVEKMERQLKKDNEKRKHHKGVEGAKGPDPNLEPPGPEETFDDAVRRDLSR